MTDFAFPLLHGPFGEDGTIQGLFEMLGKPYAGCGVTAAAISMDKIFTKMVWRQRGLPICDYAYTTAADCATHFEAEVDRIEAEIPYPVFVKPANMGSSVGISKAVDRDELSASLRKALCHDDRVIAERMVIGREFEVALLGNDVPEVSVAGEILSAGEYYDYDSKYRGGETKLSIPADLPPNVHAEIGRVAVRAYRAIDGAGFARVDLFYNESKDEIYLSEMNAIPGFTQYSMFPVLWRHEGFTYGALIERIIELGYERHHVENCREPLGRIG
jgi:D-alanine-D-alanine ligase